MKTPQFLRKLRKLKPNWKYAIGEFLIVVLGIAAAFQLDSWKENRNKNELLKEYLIDIEAGLKQDSLYYVESQKYFKYVKQNMDSTRKSLKEDKTLSEDQQKGIRELSNWYKVYITNTAFEDLNNSGRLNLIDDKSLRYQLIGYYQYIDFIKLLDQEYSQSLLRLKENILTELDFSQEYVTIPKDKLYLVKNYLGEKEFYINKYQSHRATCQIMNNDIRKTIKDFLND